MSEHKIAILSDTHSLLRMEVKNVITECEAVIHAGDIADRTTYEEIRNFCRSYFVRGNADKALADCLPEEMKFELYGFRFYMVHNKKHMKQDLSGIDIVIYGHSHKYQESRKDGIFFFNPGSCGPRRFHQPVTMAVLTLDEEEHTFSVEKKDFSPVFRPETQMLPSRDMEKLITNIMKDMDAGRSVKKIADRNRVEEEFVNQILQIYTTHQGIDVLGILNRLDIWGK